MQWFWSWTFWFLFVLLFYRRRNSKTSPFISCALYRLLHILHPGATLHAPKWHPAEQHKVSFPGIVFFCTKEMHICIWRHLPGEPTCISWYGWMWSVASSSRLQSQDRAGFCSLATEKFRPRWSSSTLTPLIPNTLLAAKKPYNESAGTRSCRRNIKRYEWLKHIIWKDSAL